MASVRLYILVFCLHVAFCRYTRSTDRKLRALDRKIGSIRALLTEEISKNIVLKLELSEVIELLEDEHNARLDLEMKVNETVSKCCVSTSQTVDTSHQDKFSVDGHQLEDMGRLEDNLMHVNKTVTTLGEQFARFTQSGIVLSKAFQNEKKARREMQRKLAALDNTTTEFRNTSGDVKLDTLENKREIDTLIVNVTHCCAIASSLSDSVLRLEQKMEELSTSQHATAHSTFVDTTEVSNFAQVDTTTLSSQVTKAPSQDRTARVFVAAFLQSYKTTYDFTLHIMCDVNTARPTTVIVDAPAGNIRHHSLSITNCFESQHQHLSNALMHVGSSLNQKYVYLSSSNTDISVVADFNLTSPESFLVLPTSVLSSRYLIASYQPIPGLHFSEFVILATDENTKVTVTLNIDGLELVYYDGRSFSDGDVIELTLNANDSVQIQCKDDLSGTWVSSSHPIAVFSGASCAFIPKDIRYCDPIVEQLWPVDIWERMYIVPPVFPRTGYVVRVFAAEDITLIRCNNGTASTTTHMLNAGMFKEFFLGQEAFIVVSDKPINVMQYAVSENFDSFHGDPYMSIVPGINHYKTSYNFYSRDELRNRVALIALEASVPNLRLDGREVTHQKVLTLPSPFHSYKVIFVNVTPGKHTITTLNSNERFGAIVYGLEDHRSYGYPAGLDYR